MRTDAELIAAAVAQSGLADFGTDTFREGLAILVQSLADEARLNARGEAAIQARLITHLVNRLEIEDWYRRYPEIDDVPIVAPLFGLSLPRTGSTVLSFLLAQDPAIRYLRHWESNKPCPPPSTVQGSDPRIPDDARPPHAGTKQHVPADINGPMECLDLMALDFKTQIYQAFARIPSYTSWLVDADLRSTYQYERRVLKLLQWGEPQRPWRLKSPAHMLWIEDLVTAFPDARFVMTHRDPTDVILSVCDVYADISASFTDELDLSYIGQLNTEQWSTGIDRVLEFRANGGDDRFYDIDFHAMRADPLGQIRGLYEWLGEPVSDEFARRMQHWWDTNAAHHEPSKHPDPAVYGLDLDELRPRFADYVAHVARWTAH